MKPMAKELTEQIFTIMEREMSDIGNFIVKKQCMLIGADPEDIQPRDLPELASNLSEVMRTFGGYEKARKIYSEIKKLENLDKVVEEEESEEKRNKMLEDLGRTCIFAAEWDKAFEYFNKLLSEAELNKDNAKISRYLRRMGFIHQERSEFNQALEYYERALEAAEEIDDSLTIGQACNRIGGIYWNKGNYDLAKEFLEKAIKHAMKSDDKRILGTAHIGLGNIHGDNHETEDAIVHYKDALKFLDGTNEIYERSRAHNNLGDTYLLQGDWNKALEQFEKCRKIGEEGGVINIVAWADFNASEALINLGELDQAKEDLDKSMEIMLNIGDKVGLGAIHQNYGRLFHAKKNWVNMEEHYKKAIEIFMEINTPLTLASSYTEFGIALKEKGENDRAKIELRRAANLYLHLNLEKQVKKVLKEIENLA